MRKILTLIWVALLLPGTAAAQSQHACRAVNLVRDLNEQAAVLGAAAPDAQAMRRFDWTLVQTAEHLAMEATGTTVPAEQRKRLGRLINALIRIRELHEDGRQRAARAHLSPDRREDRRIALDAIGRALSCDVALKNAAVHDTAHPDRNQMWAIGFAKQGYLPLALGAALLAAALGLVRRGRRRRIGRRLCLIPALLKYGSDCTMTRVLDISTRGCKLETPDIELPRTGLELYLPDRMVKARQAWSNRFYMGLNFETRLGRSALARTLKAGRASAEACGAGGPAPACFRPGCFPDCERHHPTQIAHHKARRALSEGADGAAQDAAPDVRDHPLRRENDGHLSA